MGTPLHYRTDLHTLRSTAASNLESLINMDAFGLQMVLHCGSKFDCTFLFSKFHNVWQNPQQMQLQTMKAPLPCFTDDVDSHCCPELLHTYPNCFIQKLEIWIHHSIRLLVSDFSVYFFYNLAIFLWFPLFKNDFSQPLRTFLIML